VPTEPDPLDALFASLAEADQELTEAEQQLAQASTTQDREQLQARIAELQRSRQQLIQEIERRLLPSAEAEDAAPTLLEQELESRRLRHDATLESDVGRRLPSR